MKHIPRKLLVVHREPPAAGYVVMMETDDRTRSIQLSETHGEAIMARMQEVIIEFAVQRGLVTVEQDQSRVVVGPYKRKRT